MTRYDLEAVKSEAKGRWDTIFAALAPKLALAQERAGRHVPCPVHGGKDGFRLFRNYAMKGDGICNTCGAKTDGFDMLCWVNGWTFVQALTAVAEFLGVGAEKSGRHFSRRQEPDDKLVDPSKVKSFTGTIVYAGMQDYKGTGNKAYSVVLMSPTGITQTCWGIDLKAALKSVNAVRGDRVALTKLRTEERRSNKGTYLLNFWHCDLLDEGPRHRASKKPLPEPAAQAPSTEVPSAESERHREAIEKLWVIAKPIEKNSNKALPVLRYFEKRGLGRAQWSDDALRFVPNAIYRFVRDGDPECWPALIAAVRKVDGRLVTLHRTFLTEEGSKAPVETVKKLMALPDGETINGASIQLGTPGDKLCVAEGIETALSVQYATGLPCWCALSANGLKTVEIPKSVSTVLIFADKDKSETGAQAAEALRKRMVEEGRFAVIINIPDAIPSGSKGIDWNDVLLLKGPEAFPVRK